MAQKRLTYWDVLKQLRKRLYRKKSYWIGIGIAFFGIILMSSKTLIIFGFFISLIGLLVALAVKAILMKEPIS
jgi:hypothetical protein